MSWVKLAITFFDNSLLKLIIKKTAIMIPLSPIAASFAPFSQKNAKKVLFFWSKIYNCICHHTNFKFKNIANFFYLLISIYGSEIMCFLNAHTYEENWLFGKHFYHNKVFLFPQCLQFVCFPLRYFSHSI